MIASVETFEKGQGGTCEREAAVFGVVRKGDLIGSTNGDRSGFDECYVGR